MACSRVVERAHAVTRSEKNVESKMRSARQENGQWLWSEAERAMRSLQQPKAPGAATSNLSRTTPVPAAAAAFATSYTALIFEIFPAKSCVVCFQV